ncbi:MAG TPA: tetratricopeptide repeat protein [Pyrinomonadaceae bacterium]|jgi:Flp pilus assembly protein TadD|nr:tetratricopeptide repeat protein [Pyrinomonadaceae bacterium]
MNRENILFAAVGLLLGYLIAFHLVVYVNQNQPVQRVAADEDVAGMPPDHPALAADGAQASQRTQSSIEHATKGAKQDPKNFEAQVEAGSASLEAGQAEDAIDFFTKANQLRPGDYETLVKLGNANFEARRFDVAERWYNEALAKKPEDVGVRSDLGLTFFLRDPPQPEKAVAEFQRALQYDPNHVPTLHNLTLVLAKTGDVGGAQATLARLEKLNPQNDDLSPLREEIEKARRGPASTGSDDGKGQKKS